MFSRRPARGPARTHGHDETAQGPAKTWGLAGSGLGDWTNAILASMSAAPVRQGAPYERHGAVAAACAASRTRGSSPLQARARRDPRNGPTDQVPGGARRNAKPLVMGCALAHRRAESSLASAHEGRKLALPPAGLAHMAQRVGKPLQAEWEPVRHCTRGKASARDGAPGRGLRKTRCGGSRLRKVERTGVTGPGPKRKRPALASGPLVF